MTSARKQVLIGRESAKYSARTAFIRLYSAGFFIMTTTL